MRRPGVQSPQLRASTGTPVPPSSGDHTSDNLERSQSPEPWGVAQPTGQDFRPPRMELPLFSGDNPDGWVYKTERYFLLMHLTEAQMLETAIIGLDGDALTWFQWENQRRPITS